MCLARITVFNHQYVFIRKVSVETPIRGSASANSIQRYDYSGIPPFCRFQPKGSVVALYLLLLNEPSP